MKTFAKSIGLRALTDDKTLAAARGRLSRAHIVVLMYHEVADDDRDIESWTVVRRSDLTRQLEYLTRHYDVVTIDQALDRLQSGSGAENPAAVVTFDDGNKGNLETLLPIVEAAQLPVTVYVASGHVESQELFWFDRIINALQTSSAARLDLRRFGTLGSYVFNRSRGSRNWTQFQRLLQDLKRLPPERCELVAAYVESELAKYPHRSGYHLRPMTAADVAALARSRYVEIGGHSHCHRLQSMLSETVRRESLERNRALLEEWTGRTVSHFAYPSGDFDSAVRETVLSLGFRTAVTTNSGLWQRSTDRFQIPRFGVGRYDSLATFKAGLFGGPMALLSLLVTGRGADSRQQ